MRVPRNQIITNKYTSGGELMYSSDNGEYVGYYHIIMGKSYAGKDDTIFELPILLEKYNKNTARKLISFGKKAIIISSIKYAINKTFHFNSKKDKVNNTGTQKRYFAKKIGTDQIIIREIDETNFKQLNNNPIYQTTELNYKYLDYDFNLAEVVKVEKEFTGLKKFLDL